MKLCLGTVQFGVRYGVQANGQPDMEEVWHILRAAQDNGIDTLDTAAAYGTAEEVIGAYFRSEDGKPMRVISKLAGEAIAGACDARAAALEAVNGSRARLGVPCLDGYMFHDARCIRDEKAVQALAALKEEGYVREIGVSVYTPEEALAALAIQAFTMIQVPYNVLDRRLDQCDFFDRAADRGVQVYARSALLQGLLTLPLERLPKHMAFARETLEEYQTVCAEQGFSLFETAVRFVLGHKGIDYLVFGVDNMAQLQAYLQLQGQNDSFLTQALSDKWGAVDPRIVMPNLWR